MAFNTGTIPNRIAVSNVMARANRKTPGSMGISVTFGMFRFATSVGKSLRRKRFPANASSTPNGSDTAFCSKIDITIADTTGTAFCVLPSSASACATPSSTTTLTSQGTTAVSLGTPLAAGASRTYTFTLMLDNSATNADQGLVANETLTWAFAS